MSKIEQNREHKKQAILSAAKKVFLSEGYTTASMDVIASKAKLTKQTLYRYFPSKSILFQATLEKIGESFNDKYLQHLSQENTRDALVAFAQEFMQFHLSQEHIATQRLLIAETTQTPEIIESFMSIGSNVTSNVLNTFFSKRFDLEHPNIKTDLWLGMLLAPRSSAILGLQTLSNDEIEQHAIAATDMLLFGIQPTDK